MIYKPNQITWIKIASISFLLACISIFLVNYHENNITVFMMTFFLAYFIFFIGVKSYAAVGLRFYVEAPFFGLTPPQLYKTFLFICSALLLIKIIFVNDTSALENFASAGGAVGMLLGIYFSYKYI